MNLFIYDMIQNNKKCFINKKRKLFDQLDNRPVR